MKLEIASAALRLVRGQTLKLTDGVGSTICARQGTVWITEENSSRDVVLEPGDCHRIGNPGLTLVQACADAQVSLA
ncbi:MAG: DUF2917 domain-containing protein [Burkholderiales bacterium]|nr:DUF2917 domain-containing protein [Burkholderiales bacterium]